MLDFKCGNISSRGCINKEVQDTPVNSDSSLPQPDPVLYNIIEVDVKRSFNYDKKYNKQALLDLLKKGTAKMHKTANYCQGMNYIAGMLLYQNLSESNALTLYTLIIEGRMHILFDENLSYLKIYFFVLDNLLAIFMKEISADFLVG